MAAELTPARIAELARDAQIEFCLDKHPSFEVALVRKVEAALATQQAAQGAEPVGESYRDGMNVDALARALTLMGVASAGREEMAAGMALFVNQLARSVERYFERLNTSPPPTAEVEKDAARFEWFFSRGRGTSDTLIDLSVRQVNGDMPTLAEWRSAIDAAFQSDQAKAGKGDGHDQ